MRLKYKYNKYILVVVWTAHNGLLYIVQCTMYNVQCTMYNVHPITLSISNNNYAEKEKNMVYNSG